MHNRPGTCRNLLWVLKQTLFSGAKKKEQIFGALAIVLFLTVSPLLAETVRVGTFFNGNNSFLNPRAYI